MRVKFWGVRGSAAPSHNTTITRNKVERVLRAALEAGLSAPEDIPAFVDALPFPLRGTYGSNTPCVQVELDSDHYLLLDAGMGLRDFGEQVTRSRAGSPGAVYHLLLSHLHWDHIQGLPFFTPAYIPGNRIIVYGCHEGIEQALVQQQTSPFFPVPLYEAGAVFEFRKLTQDDVLDIAGVRVSAIRQHHPGVSYTYRLEQGGSTFVYATDCEHHLSPAGHDRNFVDFINNAELVVLDAQYDFATSLTLKKDWGHSSNVVAVEMAKEARVKRLCLFHHEPTESDDSLLAFFQQTLGYAAMHKPEVPLELFMAYDGLEVEI